MFSPKISELFFLKLHIQANICLIYTTNENENNMQFADEVCFGIYYRKKGEIKFNKKTFPNYLKELSDDFFFKQKTAYEI